MERVSWIEGKTNKEVLDNFGEKCRLMESIKIR